MYVAVVLFLDDFNHYCTFMQWINNLANKFLFKIVSEHGPWYHVDDV